jgi:hypothetical protein
LRNAKDGTYPDYNVGVILARILSYDVSYNESKPLYAGSIATMVYEHIKKERKFRNIGTEVLVSNLLDFDMLLNMDIIRMWNDDFVMYKYMVRRGTFPCTVLPRLEYFEAPANDAWEEAPDHDIWEEEVPEPSHQEVLEEVPAPPQDAWYEPAMPTLDTWYAPAPPASGTWGNAPAAPDYHPGEGSSSS